MADQPLQPIRRLLKWRLNAGKSDDHQAAPMLPETTLDIVQDAGTLTTRTLMSLDGRNHATEVKFTTDKKECLNAGEAVEDLRGTCWIDNGRVRIRTEAAGATAERAPGAGVHPPRECVDACFSKC